MSETEQARQEILPSNAGRRKHECYFSNRSKQCKRLGGGGHLKVLLPHMQIVNTAVGGSSIRDYQKGMVYYNAALQAVVSARAAAHGTDGNIGMISSSTCKLSHPGN